MLLTLENRNRAADAPRTSRTHPLQIAVIAGSPFRGALGVTFAPGKKDPTSRPAPWARDLSTDLDTIVAWKARIVLTLIEPHEIEFLGISGLCDAIRGCGMDWLHLPIRDVSVPDSIFEQVWPAHSAELRRRLRAGENLLVHCRGGLGRAGMIAARLMVEEGVPAETAIAAVRAARPGAIETDAQEDWVRAGRRVERRRRASRGRQSRIASPADLENVTLKMEK